MQIQITHKTELNFESKTFLNPQIIRMVPFNLGYYKLLDFERKISPSPVGISSKKDVVNNTVNMIWFNDPISNLTIDLNMRLHLTPFDPNEFMIYPEEFKKLNFRYSRKRWQLLVPYLETSIMSRGITKLAKDHYNNSNNETLTFIFNLLNEVRAFVTSTASQTPPQHPSETIEKKAGSAEELSTLLLHMLRANGIATRYVSGYYFSDSVMSTNRHMWLQVYLPGPGWLGIDATTGTLTDHRYIPVAASPYNDTINLINFDVDGEQAVTQEEQVSIKRMG